METVPAAVLAAYLELSGEKLDPEVLARCGRRLGNRVECELGSLAQETGAGIAEALRSYAAQCREFTGALEAGGVEGEYAVLVRPLVNVRQKDSKEERRDLGAELDALSLVAGLGAVVEAACSADPDWDEICALGAPYGAAVEHSGNDTAVRFVVEARVVWPETLGGPAAGNELARHITLQVNHAAWRDRRNRRLVALEIAAEEIWPLPRQAPVR